MEDFYVEYDFEEEYQLRENLGRKLTRKINKKIDQLEQQISDSLNNIKVLKAKLSLLKTDEHYMKEKCSRFSHREVEELLKTMKLNPNKTLELSEEDRNSKEYLRYFSNIGEKRYNNLEEACQEFPSYYVCAICVSKRNVADKDSGRAITDIYFDELQMNDTDLIEDVYVINQEKSFNGNAQACLNWLRNNYEISLCYESCVYSTVALNVAGYCSYSNAFQVDYDKKMIFAVYSEDLTENEEEGYKIDIEKHITKESYIDDEEASDDDNSYLTMDENELAKSDRNILQLTSQWASAQSIIHTCGEAIRDNKIYVPENAINLLTPEKYNMWLSAKGINTSDYKLMNKIKKEDAERLSEIIREIEEKNKKIELKDFVVRRTSMKCMGMGHKVVDVVATVKIMDNSLNIYEIQIDAGYCESCNIFFIFDDVFQRIQRYGKILCKVITEIDYINGRHLALNDMMLAKESILKIYGYSVSEKDNMPEEARRKILLLLIEEGVLTKSDIISYLKFFISMHHKNSTRQKAVKKWEEDMNYVRKYGMIGDDVFGVKSIHRKIFK